MPSNQFNSRKAHATAINMCCPSVKGAAHAWSHCHGAPPPLHDEYTESTSRLAATLYNQADLIDTR